MTAKQILCVLVASLLALTSAFSMIIPANEHAQPPEKSKVIGDAWDLEKTVFIHYAKPTGNNPKTQACYKLMGVKWTTTPVSYVINPSNPQGLSESFVTSAMSTSAETWDAATSTELFNDVYQVDYNAQISQDYKNVIVFADLNDNNVIAVTTVWYTRIGKRIVEFDQEYNTYFQWGDASVDASKMDLQSIATHELGHAIGLSDIYTTSCSSVTMYGYGSEGDTSSRTLESADITGLKAMYG